MSDGDVFCRVAAIGWRPVAKAFRDGVDPAIAGLRIEDALARELRFMGGLTSPEVRHQLRIDDSSEPPTPAEVVELLRHLVHRRVSDRVFPLLVGSRFAAVEEADRYLDRCLQNARLIELARSACRHPDGKGLRRSPRPRRTLSDLLSDSAPLGANA
jgi:hypothetical protein